jgi:nucleoside-diphosphate-sugar epimerase
MAPILLTGASGYLGSRVAACLRHQGLPFDVLPCRLEDIVPASLPYHYVIHCAGKTSRSSEVDFFSANTQGTIRLLDGLSPLARVVFVSTRKVYPKITDVCIDEDHDTGPWDDYGASKLAAEQRLRASRRDVVIFRAGTMFGHPSRNGKFPDLALQGALAGQSIALAMPSRREDYLDVDLMAALLVQACSDGPHWGQVFNISGPVRELDGMLDALNRASLDVCATPITVRRTPFPIPCFPWLDVRKLQSYFPGHQQLDDQQIFSRMLRVRLNKPVNDRKI